MMRAVRLLTALLAVATLGVAAGSARSATAAPTGLHAFVLRADEPTGTSFANNPSFAWRPVPGALHYEFQLSLSNTFRDNAVVWADSSATTPVEAPPITLPWITGNPHSLYARVRAITLTGATPWSTPYGFDMTPPEPPAPVQPSYPGLLRWNLVPGASGYQIWNIDNGKIEFSTTNTLDERDLYTFHTSSAYIGTVHWRIRALRINVAGRLNGIPAVQYGPWSGTYTATNPAMATGPIALVGTVSDIFSNGAAGSAAHKLMPAFLWSGNQTLLGAPAELFRVEVFTDKQCINRVYTGAVIGSPAYSPRPGGPLELPTTLTGITTARSSILPDGAEPAGYTLDGEQLTAAEAEPPVTPTTSVPGAPGDGQSSTTSPGSSSSSSTPVSTSGSSSTVSVLKSAPTDLWDTNWPQGGYYWTVLPVQAVSPGGAQTTLSSLVMTGATDLPVANGTGFKVGDAITIGSGTTGEGASVIAVSSNSLTLASPLKSGHGAGESVLHTGGPMEYEDMELAQDVCAAGREMRFGKASQPSLTSSGAAFATGLSSEGRLISAVHTSKFYGAPLVSWMPAVGAEAYEVQWAQKPYPFVAQPTSSGAPGLLTYSTSAVLPLTPGTWWYRVRGFDYSLPTGSQQMSWSTPVRLVVASPSFSVLGGPSAAPATGTKSSASAASVALRSTAGDGFTMGIPSGWTKLSVPDSVVRFAYLDRITRANVNVIPTTGRNGRTFAQWASALAGQVHAAVGVTPTTSTTTLQAGTAVRLVFVRSSGDTKIVQVQYAVDASKTAYVITFTTTSARYAKDQLTFSKMIASFRLG